jgi:hypothetical protein
MNKHTDIHPAHRRITAALTVAAMLLLVAACGGTGKTPLTDTGLSADAGTSTDAKEVSRVPGNLLPPPKTLFKRLSTEPVAACPGSGFDPRLPNHRVSTEGPLAVFSPGKNKGKGKGKANGTYAYAVYHVIPPEGTKDGDEISVTLRTNPLYEGETTYGESQLYVGIPGDDHDGDGYGDDWDWAPVRDYNSSRSNNLRVSLGNHNSSRSNRTRLLAVAVSNDGGGGGGAGKVHLEKCSLSSGWSSGQDDAGQRSSSISPGLHELSAELAPDGSSSVSYFTGGEGLRHVRCADGRCVVSSISQTAGTGPNLDSCVSSRGTPHVASWDSSSSSGPFHWMARGADWQRALYDRPGPDDGMPFDPTVCPEAVLDERGNAHVFYSPPGSSTLYHAFETKKGHTSRWSQEVVAKGISVSGKPFAYISKDGSPVCIVRTSGGDGAVLAFSESRRRWKRKHVSSVACPVGPDGTPIGSLSGDLDQDGRVDVLLNSPKGDVLLHLYPGTDRVKRTELGTGMGSSVISCVSSSGGSSHVFSYDAENNQVRYTRCRAGKGVVHRDVAARLAVTEAGVKEHVTHLDAILDPDDDGDGISTARCFMKVSSPSLTNDDVLHWTLEVRVNRIEMA